MTLIKVGTKVMLIIPSVTKKVSETVIGECTIGVLAGTGVVQSQINTFLKEGL
jgi:hypothetical protein